MDPLAHTKLKSFLVAWDGEHVIVNQEDKPSELVTKLALDVIGTTSDAVLDEYLTDISSSPGNEELSSKVDKLRSILVSPHGASREQIERDLGLNTWEDSPAANRAKEVIISCYLSKDAELKISGLNLRFSDSIEILRFTAHHGSKLGIKALLSNPYFYEKIMFSYPPTLTGKIEFLFLITGSSRSRKFGLCAPHLGTNTRAVIADMRKNLSALQESLPPDDINLQEIERLIDQLDEATLCHLECDDYPRLIKSEPGPWLIPINIATSFGQHSVAIELTKEENGTFTMLVFNSGFGTSRSHLHQDDWDDRVYPLIISGIDPSSLDEDFFSNLTGAKFPGNPLASSRANPCEEFYSSLSHLGTQSETGSSAMNLCISAISKIMYTDPISFESVTADPYIRGLLLTNREALEGLENETIQAFFSNPSLQEALALPLPTSIQKAMRPYYPQGQIGNCSAKCLSTWLHSSMPASLYSQFKAFRESSLVTEIETRLAGLRGQLALIDPNPATLDERVFNELHLDPALELKSMDHLQIFLAIAKSKSYGIS